MHRRRSHGFRGAAWLFLALAAAVLDVFDAPAFTNAVRTQIASLVSSVGVDLKSRLGLRFNDADKDSALAAQLFDVDDYDGLPRRFDRDILLDFFSSRPAEIAWRWSEILQELWPTWDNWHREESLPAGQRTRGAMLRTALSRLGPVFVKIGQTLSERPDLIGDEAAEELKLLQQENEPFSTEVAFATILEDLNHSGPLVPGGMTLKGDPAGPPLFASITEQPVAAASLGQVYKATTLDGQTVAVKVQRPGSLKQVALDWTCWALGLMVLDVYWGGQGDEYPKIADEVARGVFKELDYHNEAYNAELFLKKHRFLPFVTAPQWLPEYTGPKGTARVLTLEWIHGRKLQEIESEEERMKMVDMAVEACVSSLVFTGFVHADPHAGNLILTEDGRLAFLDFGLMGTVEPHIMEGFAAGIQHLLAERWLLLAKVMQDVGFMAVGDEGGFKKVVDPTARVFEYTSCPDEEFAAALEKQMKAEEGGLSRFGALAGALSKLSYHYHMVMPGYIILFIRTFLTLEGIAGVVRSSTSDRMFSGETGRPIAFLPHARRPDFNIYEASLPYAMQRALSPKTKAAVAALRQNFVTETGSPQWETLDALVSQAEAETNDSNTADAGHAAHAGAEANSASSSSSSSSSSNYAEVLQRVLASPQGSALRRIFADLDAQQLLQGLAGKKGRPLRDLASNALAERLRRLPVSLRFPWRRPRPAHSAHSATAATAVQALAPTLTAPMAPMAPMAPTTYERRQRERREKSMKIIGGLQLQRFRGRAAAVAIVAALTITFRVSFWAIVKAFRFSAGKKFSNVRPAE